MSKKTRKYKTLRYQSIRKDKYVKKRGISGVGRILVWALSFTLVFFAGTFLASEPHLFENKLQVEVEAPEPVVELQRDIVVVPGSILTDPRYPKIGKPVSVSVKLKNEGNLAVKGTFDVRFSINGHEAKKLIVNGLNPGQEQIVYVELELKRDIIPDKTLEMTVTADAGGVIRESNKQNNIAAAVLTVER